jgi:alkylation response protein AidB-like acyl-CoA dehydrogenase
MENLNTILKSPFDIDLLMSKIERDFNFQINKKSSAFPLENIEKLHQLGLLLLPLPPEYGGQSLGTAYEGFKLAVDVLEAIGSKDLSLARLYEGHINAVKLVRKFGNDKQMNYVSQSVSSGHMFAIWNTEFQNKLRLKPYNDWFKLIGSKVFASGVGKIQRALVTAHDPNGKLVILMIELNNIINKVNFSKWRFNAMVATGTGEIDLTGLEIQSDQIIGAAGDYFKEPDFSSGAWRTLAAQTGAIKTLCFLFKTHITENHHSEHPVQRARLGDMLIAYQTCHQWVLKCAELAEGEGDAKDIIASPIQQ